ncbi:MAG: diguanylate cyclase (GGDEF)-like protein [Alphaproteobacteria bacterium]|jgi:diguanylate cyclase (GGDEF)-like protein
MIKTDFSPPQKIANDNLPFFALSTILYGLNFGVLGAVTNAFLSVNFFGDFTLYFGQIFVLFCLVARGLNAGIIAALIASIATAAYANDPYLVVIFSLEILFVHVCMRKGYFLFQSSMSYWLIIGIPLLLFLHALTSFVSAEVLFIGGVTRGLNGLICISVVAICCWFLPSHFIYNKYYSTPPQLSSLIFSLCMLTVTLPAMVIALFFIWQSTIQNEKIIERELTTMSSQLATINNIELQRHLSSLETVSTILKNNPDAKLQPLIIATAKNYDLFESVILANQYGDVLGAAPLKYNLKLNELKSPSMRSRRYFKDAKESPSAFITDALVASDFGNKPIIGFVSPILIDAKFSGLVKGAMNLDQLTAFNNRNMSDDYLYIISDSKNRVIARSEKLNLELLSNFDYSIYKDPLIKRLPVLSLNQNVYLYQQSKTQNDWTITLMVPPHTVTSVLVEYFFVLVLATIFVLAAFAFIAKSLSRKITKPLVDIAENFPNPELHPKIIRESQVSSEMVKLTQKLIDSHEVMSNFHQQLSEQVHNKTKQLKQLNRELYSIAQKDSLTQLLNRAGFNRLAITSYRNCVRSHINMSLIFIDIDHFKLVNDTHGHPFGDKCIIAVAKTIQKHCKRDTDIIGRYGGEEFIIMIVGGEIKEHHERVTLIKDEIEKLSLLKGNNIVKMTISAGICSLHEDFSIDYEDLLQLSDNQLYISKREGRNKISAAVR